MDDTTMVEMVHVSGEEPETHLIRIEAGERLIPEGMRVKHLYVLKEGTVMIMPARGVKTSLTRTEYVALDNERSVLGAHPFFSAQPSRFAYTALTDCTFFRFDSRMFQTEKGGKGLSKDALLGIARALVINSDISEIFVPKIAKALGYDIPKGPTLPELLAGIELITSARNAVRFQELAFDALTELLRKHELVQNGQASVVGSRALASEMRRQAVPPPAPRSLARRVWEASRFG